MAATGGDAINGGCEEYVSAQGGLYISSLAGAGFWLVTKVTVDDRGLSWKFVLLA